MNSDDYPVPNWGYEPDPGPAIEYSGEFDTEIYQQRFQDLWFDTFPFDIEAAIEFAARHNRPDVLPPW